MRVTVVGAGVAGLTAAIELAERGCAVEVLERGPSLGVSSCSRWAGGMLAPWCERETAEELVVELGREALEWWPRHHPDTERRGTLVVALRRDQPDLERFARRTQGYQRLDGDGIAALEPDLGGRFAKGLLFPEEAHLDPRAALASLAFDLERRGVAIRFGVEAAEVPGLVLDCRGLAARDRLPDLRGVKGEMLVVRCPDAVAEPAGAAAAPALPALHRAARRGTVHDRRHHDRERRAWQGDRPLGGRAPERRLCAASGVRRGRDPGAGCRRAAGLPRQSAAPAPAGRHASTSTASTATASCWHRHSHGERRPCCWTGPTFRR